MNLKDLRVKKRTLQWVIIFFCFILIKLFFFSIYFLHFLECFSGQTGQIIRF
jgi:hypothetical protein